MIVVYVVTHYAICRKKILMAEHRRSPVSVPVRVTAGRKLEVVPKLFVSVSAHAPSRANADGRAGARAPE